MSQVKTLISNLLVVCALATMGCGNEATEDANGAGTLSATATIAPFAMGAVTGTATFTQSGTDVTVVVSLSNCPDGPHGVHVHQGTSCADAMTQGGHWDMTRGEGIPDVTCAAGTGTASVTRPATDPLLAWSIGGAATTNVIGHAFVVHSPGDPAPRIGCGVITSHDASHAGSGGVGGASGAAGMMVGTGGTAGMVGTGGTAGMVGTGGMHAAQASATAAIAPFEMGTVMGTAAFAQHGADVSLVVTLSNCPDGPHGVHIHQGTSCADAMMQGAHWDMTRGEGIPDVVCAAGTGTSMVTRAPTDPLLAWSIGGDATTNVIGHAFVVHSPGDPAPRIGCGVIQ